jgi:hypothetical protein
MKLNYLFLFVIICGLLVIDTNSVRIKRKRRTIIEGYAHRFFKYMNLDKLEYKVEEKDMSDGGAEGEGKCNSIDDMNKYFFDVYRDSTSDPLDIETLIEYQVKRGERTSNAEIKQRTAKCNRRKVFFIFFTKQKNY